MAVGKKKVGICMVHYSAVVFLAARDIIFLPTQNLSPHFTIIE